MAFGFDDSVNFGTIATPKAWVGPFVLTGTLANTATTCTSITNPPGTAGLAVGQAVSGTGITPGTTIAAIVSISAITLSQNTTSSAVGAQTLTFAGLAPAQSVFAGASGFMPMMNPLSVPTPGSAFMVPDVQIIPAAGLYVPAAGRGLLVVAAGATTPPALQYNIQTVWTTVATFTVSVTSAIYIMADGINVRFNNLASASSTITFYREQSSQS